MQGLTLYQLNSEIKTLLAEIETAEAEEDTAAVAALEAALNAQFTAIDKKRESYCHVIRSVDAQAKALREESKYLALRAKHMERLSQRLKDAVHEDMASTGEVRADAGIFTLRIAASPEKVEVEVPAEFLPPQYQNVKVTPNSKALKDALKNGVDVEGCYLTQGTHLRIR